MKISFSTLACPDYSWSDIYPMAKDLGFDGIEVRGIGAETCALYAEPFTAAKLDSTIEKLNKLNFLIGFPHLKTYRLKNQNAQ